MKKLIFTTVIVLFCIAWLSAQNPSVRIKLYEEERFRFTDNRLEFLNPGNHIMIGDSAGAKIYPSALFNVYIGNRAGYTDTSGQFNVFIGNYAGTANTNGNRNTFIGTYAGLSNTTGLRNTYVGLSAGAFNTTGSYNTCIGRVAGYNNFEGSGNVFLGNAAGFNEMGSNKLYISNDETSSPLIYGEFDNSFLRLNSNYTELAGDVMAYGRIQANDRFNATGLPGQDDTLTYVTDIDFANNLLRYRTSIYTGGILTYTSNKSEWVGTVTDPVFSCGSIGVIGEFTGWGWDYLMVRDDSNPDLWSMYLFLTTANEMGTPDGIIEVKFRADKNWTVNWGSTEFPAGTGYQDGPNIPLPLNPNFDTTGYYITFNCATGEYVFTDVSR